MPRVPCPLLRSEHRKGRTADYRVADPCVLGALQARPASSIGRPPRSRERKRPEGLEAGAARLVGTGRDAIVGAVEALFNRPASGAPGANPYGDGWASERIARVLAARFGMDPGPEPPGFAPHWSPPAPPLGPIAEKRPRPVDGP